MAITREEVERMEEQAGLSRRFNAASDDYVARNNPRLRAMERESVLRTAEADVYNKARQRRIDSQRLVAIADPGRFSPFERNSLLGIDKNGGALIDRQERAGLRAHELAIADKGIEQERVKAWGMANQGGVAAGIRAGVDRELGRAQHGYFDDDGNYVPGSTVHAAEATGLWKSELNENNWQNRKALKKIGEEGSDRRQQKKIEAENEKMEKWIEQHGLDREAKKGAAEERTSRIKERQAQQAALREQKDFEKFLINVNNYDVKLSPEERKAFYEMSPDEQKEFWKKKVGREDQQNNGAPAAGGKPKEGDRRETANGMAVFMNGKWVLETK